MNELLIVTASILVFWGVFLGWPIAVLFSKFCDESRVVTKRLVQSHVGSFLMGALLLGFGSLDFELDNLLQILLAASSCIFPQTFLVQSFWPSLTLKRYWVFFSMVPIFVLLTVSYGWLAIEVVNYYSKN